MQPNVSTVEIWAQTGTFIFEFREGDHAAHGRNPSHLEQFPHAAADRRGKSVVVCAKDDATQDRGILRGETVNLERVQKGGDERVAHRMRILDGLTLVSAIATTSRVP